ncbi:IS701 family transposase [Paludisphaera mucosa]|uniref:IS701 family transposase n=1 Tax=Paludisphaera mucosa TaxID=3030827 RepID=A0ABT6FJ56_9BACT|nr:IS701 family transposase [Paludisphaera mucosa]MDG3002607.1 IS701 family transposase [Paludisphaera mucosa]MDG3007584.1 IS701 family transposase [Paludisphaera mucosa]
MASTGSVVTAEDVHVWGEQLDQVARRIGARFARSETRDRVRACLEGLLAPVRRKNSWRIAEQIGEAAPYGVQHLLGRADWDPDAVRDDLRAHVVDALGEPDAVLILDETGFLKKGARSAGVARQYTGTAGRIENAQVGVFLAYASRHGAAFLDRALYLPKEWTDDPERCEAAGVPEATEFAAKIRLAKRMLERALAAGTPAAWVVGDEVYGAWELRRWLEERKRPYVLGVRADQYLPAGRPTTATALAGALTGRSRRTVEVAAGSKGPRRYAWARAEVDHDLGPEWRRWLLVRKGLDERGELAYYIAAAPARTPLAALARAAGARWAIEGAFEAAKQEVGLAGYEVRSWTGWHRHVTLALLAHAVLAAVRRLADGPPKERRTGPRS